MASSLSSVLDLIDRLLPNNASAHFSLSLDANQTSASGTPCFLVEDAAAGKISIKSSDVVRCMRESPAHTHNGHATEARRITHPIACILVRRARSPPASDGTCSTEPT